jgi:DNA-binding CsgD family transcriptional regulator
MELLERGNYVDDLAAHYRQVQGGSGHTVFLMGEAGIGKTSLVDYFIKKIDNTAVIYAGACDSLFTPRPLGPLFDIAPKVGPAFIELLRNEKDRSLIFAALVQKLSATGKPVVLVFEDIHWADEATIDLIKFLARRIYHHSCLFLLTYRDDEIQARHPLAAIFGELPPEHFSKVPLKRFSREMVDQLAVKKGLASGQQLFTLTGGNPFYVMEILRSDESLIPERVKDSILTLYHAREDDTKKLWEFLSILPSSHIEPRIAKHIEQHFSNCIDECISHGVIVQRPGHLSFKHELFRLAIEESLSPYRRRSLHRQMLDIMQASTTDSQFLSQLVHHARYADERELVAKIAPQAARQAAAVGAHREAVKLYATAIEYTDQHDPALVELYERHAYECYLTYQLSAAIASQEKALEIWRARKNSLKEGDTLRFLSRLWWFTANQKKAIEFAQQSVEVLENGFPTRERAWAYSNFSQITMLAEDYESTLLWGNKAIDLATRLEDDEILSHALNNVGNMLLKMPASEKEGEKMVNKSLALAWEKGYVEHVARAYVNKISSFILTRRYEKAMATFELGFKYCDERDLDFLSYYMLFCKAQVLLETGKWDEAEAIARRLLPNPHHRIVKMGTLATLAKLTMRRGNFEEAGILIDEAKSLAWPTHEAQRIIPVLTAALELAWLSGGPVPIDEIREAEITLFYQKNHSWHYTSLAYWMHKCGLQENEAAPVEYTEPYNLQRSGHWKEAAERWREIGCPYEQALALFEGDDEHQRQTFQILHALGGGVTSEKLRSNLKERGVRNIPRGPHESTRKNPAMLTDRQLEILNLLKEGAPNKVIADKLFISPKTVDHHITAILSKLEVHSRAKAILEAQKLGILK